MARSVELQAIITLQDRMSKELSGVARQLDVFGRKSSSTAGSVAKGFLSSAAAIGVAHTALNGLRSAMSFIGESLKLGAEFSQMEVALAKVAENAGISTKQINKWKDSLADANTFGLAATDTIKRFVQGGLQGMVDFEKFTLVVKDFAATAGVESKEAIDAFTRSLLTLRPEFLDQFGISLNLVEVYRKTAVALGKKTTALTDVEKRQALLNEIMRQGTRVAGVYNATYETSGKNLLSLESLAKNLKEALGSILEPAMFEVTNALVKLGKEALGFINSNKEAWTDWIKDNVVPLAKRFVDWLTRIKDGIPAAFEWLKKNKGVIFGILTAIGAFFLGIFGYLVSLIAPMLAFGAAFGIIAGAVGYLAFTFKDELVGAVEFVRDKLKTFWENNGEQIMRFIESVKNIAKSILGILWDAIKVIWGVLSRFWQENGRQILKVVGFLGELALAFIVDVAKAIETVVGWVKSLWDWLKKIMGSKIVSFFKDVFFGAINLVVEAVEGLVGGFKKLLGLQDEVIDKNTKLRSDGLYEITNPDTGRVTVVPGYADGGVAKAGQPSIVGERGPELFVPGATGSVIPNHALGGITINFNGSISMSSDRDIREVGRMLADQLRLAQQGAF